MNQVQQINENAQHEILKSTNIAIKTPMKLPFKDATNNSLKKSNELCTKPKTLEIIDDFSDFQFAKNQACFCCGENRKLDGEILFQNLISAEFLDVLDSYLRIPEWDTADDTAHDTPVNTSFSEMIDLKKINDYLDPYTNPIIEDDYPYIALEEILPFDIEFDPQISHDLTNN